MPTFEFYRPKRITGTKTFTQRIWDPQNNTGYIATMSIEQVIHQRQSGMVYADEHCHCKPQRPSADQLKTTE